MVTGNIPTAINGFSYAFIEDFLGDIFSFGIIIVLSFISSFNPLNKDQHIKSIMMANGKATVIEAVCNTCKPPANSKTAATIDWMTPHVILIFMDGFKFPLSLSIPKT